MFRKIGVCLLALGAASTAYAGGGIGYSTTDSEGTVERVVEKRVLSGDRVGAMVSYTRTDGSRSFVEYAVSCAPLSFAYLGITSDAVSRTPNLRTVRVASDALLSNEKRPVVMIPLSDETNETSIREMATAVCS